MAGSGEQIYREDLGGGVAALWEAGDVAGEGLRVAGDIDYLFRGKGSNVF